MLSLSLEQLVQNYMKPINAQQTLWISVRVEVVNYPRPFLAEALILQAINAHAKKRSGHARLNNSWRYPITSLTIISLHSDNSAPNDDNDDQLMELADVETKGNFQGKIFPLSYLCYILYHPKFVYTHPAI